MRAVLPQLEEIRLHLNAMELPLAASQTSQVGLIVIFCILNFTFTLKTLILNQEGEKMKYKNYSSILVALDALKNCSASIKASCEVSVPADLEAKVKACNDASEKYR